MKPEVSIIIVSYNTRELLKKCIASLQKYVHTPHEIIVVDNASTDGSCTMLHDNFPLVQTICNASNQGFAKANNQGLKIATGNLLLLLNPDTECFDHSLDNLLRSHAAMHESDMGISTCRLLNSDGSHQPSTHKFYSFFSTLTHNRWYSFRDTAGVSSAHKVQIDWAHGAVMVFYRSLLDRVGYLDERFFIYAEEIDYYKRCSDAGLANYIFPSLSIMHHGGASARQQRTAMFIQNYRALFQYIQKHHGAVEYSVFRVRTIVFQSIWLLFFGIKGVFRRNTEFGLYLQTLKWTISWSK